MEEMQVIKENGLRTDLYAFNSTAYSAKVMLNVGWDGDMAARGVVEVGMPIDEGTGQVLGVVLTGVNFKGVAFKETLPQPIEIHAHPSPDAIIKYIFRVAKEILTGDSTK